MTELLRTGAERLIYQAVEVELLELLAEYSERRTEDNKAGVTWLRNFVHLKLSCFFPFQQLFLIVSV
ncbi:MAG: hypothetical protein KZQ66_11025 [Candidatus Thiodiazotropha sp. (ex Lucinoma aequizonata)]|nr:hypothetical protein [Candidatus Thiodiazotropha sp. (ex Lucinoma aequizonata)]MCU7895628.1 hypothetical protein [Candidatus Thiodiazotropha sp. (ex Lucinoma aequizonata)]MCU7899313.1 hypothetical protein [Candidatus Thiodiazotropha sp. (ex Lucinoma aequizonata)]MCU7902456.1 hypothetical protein [Candidatus Thiodiazotropha sp. (ex Lucinoma aequizonata)]MCU7908593.1 hypothetical protein [Candidatus Thiodiazotropha sp. (ex Lucinoma aequizonata)]